MELADYARVIWSRKGLILLIAVATVMLAAIITMLLPKVYASNVRLLLVSGASQVTGNYVPETEKEARFNSYFELVQDPSFQRAVVAEARRKSGFAALPGAKTLRADAFDIMVEGSYQANLIMMTVQAADPALAKALADAAGATLIVKAGKLESAASDELSRAVTKQLAVTDKELVRLREEYKRVAFGRRRVKSIERDVKLSHVGDQIQAAEAIRRSYSDLLGRLALNKSLERSPFQLIYAAANSNRPIKPNLSLNLLVAALVGLLFGAGAALWLESVGPAVAEKRESLLDRPV